MRDLENWDILWDVAWSLLRTFLWFLAWTMAMLGLIPVLPSGNAQSIPIFGIMLGLVGWVVKSGQTLVATKRYEEASNWIKQMPLWLFRVLYTLAALFALGAIVWHSYWLAGLAATCLAVSSLSL